MLALLGFQFVSFVCEYLRRRQVYFTDVHWALHDNEIVTMIRDPFSDAACEYVQIHETSPENCEYDLAPATQGVHSPAAMVAVGR